MIASRTNLAWANLVQSAPRMLASLGGVAFAVVLMFLEMGFLNGLYDSQINVVQKFDADLVIVNAHKQAVCPTQPFPRRRLQQARMHPAVAGAYPVFLDELRSTWRNEKDGKSYPVLVFGFHPADPVFTIPAVRRQAHLLTVPGTALLDQQSKPFYGPIRPGVEGELARHKVRLVGTFPLGPDFRVDGTMLVGERTFLRCFANAVTGATDSDRIEFGLIKLAPGSSVPAVQAALERELPDDVTVLTLDQLCGRVKEYWGNSKPVGYVFGLGMLIGFVIGVMICYQILYTDVVDHLPQFATLKAMGYSNDFLINVVLKQATYLALIGFTPGLVVSWVLYRALESVSGIPMILNGPRIALVFVFTLIMCLVSGSIAIRRAVELDPAEVF